MANAIPSGRSTNLPQGAGLKNYLKEAFFFRWNLLSFSAVLAGAAIAPLSDVTLPLVVASELTYLTGLIAIPAVSRGHRCQGARDSADRTGSSGRRRPRSSRCSPVCRPRRGVASNVCTPDALKCARIAVACARCGGCAARIRGRNSNARLDRLLWLFLRLLLSKTALDRFLQTMSSEAIAPRVEQLRKDLAAAQSCKRRARRPIACRTASRWPSCALDNYERAKKNAQFVSIELDRIEGKIQALAEMAVNRQDPDFLSSQVDSAAESMRQTEKAVTELQHLTGLADQLQEPPPILESDLREVLRHDA